MDIKPGHLRKVHFDFCHIANHQRGKDRMRRKENRKWVLHFKGKHPSVVMEEGGGACGWRQVGAGAACTE